MRSSAHKSCYGKTTKGHNSEPKEGINFFYPYAPWAIYDDKHCKFQKDLLKNEGGVALTKLRQTDGRTDGRTDAAGDPIIRPDSRAYKCLKFQKSLLRNERGVALTKLRQVAIRFSCYLAY